MDDIATDTEFNGIRVLSAAQTITLQAGSQSGQTLTISVSGAKTNDLGVNTVSVSSMAGAVSALMPPSTSSSIGRWPIIRRIRRILSSWVGMKD